MAHTEMFRYSGLAKFPFKKFHDAAARREYLKQRDVKHNWVFPRVDKAHDDFIDLMDFAKSLFPQSVVRQMTFAAIVDVYLKKKRALFLRDVIVAMRERVKVSNTTINDVWKCMLRSGLLFKKYRRDPAQLSAVFAARLTDMAKYWENLVSTTEGRPRRKP